MCEFIEKMDELEHHSARWEIYNSAMSDEILFASEHIPIGFYVN